MATGNLSPRQRMINLMYLVFIAMLALNMSKEVLSAFGLMNKKLVASNKAAEMRNNSFIENLNQKASDQPEKYKPLKAKAEKIHELAAAFNSYLSDLKTQMQQSVDDPTDYEIMDKSDYLDNLFFRGDLKKPAAKEFLKKINDFRQEVTALIGDTKGLQRVVKDIEEKFSTAPATNRDGKKRDWLEFYYKRVPLVASLTKITQLQADIKTSESEILSNMLAGTQTIQLSMTNYTTLLETEKSAYFNGERFTGQIVLGRKDETTKPSRIELALDGRPLSKKQYSIEGGKVKLNISAGAPGEHTITGQLIFLEGGQETPVPVKSSFVTVSKPNSATISADKMNVVYRGVQNPMTISFSGVSDNNISVRAQGLRRLKGSKYVMDPSRISGREVVIAVSGKLSDGQSVSDKATFRIKDLPKPTGTIRGEDGAVKMQRNTLGIATIGAKFDDFDFELPLSVSEFKFKVPGQPTIRVRGNKLNSTAKKALRKAKRGTIVQIFDIKAKAKGVSVILKKVSPVAIELTN